MDFAWQKGEPMHSSRFLAFSLFTTVRAIFIVLLSLIFLPAFANADTVITGAITSDTTWSPSGGVYIVNDGFSVQAGAILTILPGTIVKVKSFGGGLPTIYGKIIAHGTSEQPIYFTSFWDDSVGGDTDGVPDSSSNRWPGLYFKQGSEGDFDFINISDAGTGGDWGTGDYISIENDGGTLTIKHSNIHDNRMTVPDGGSGTMVIGNGIWNKSGNLTVSDSNFENNAIGIIAESGTIAISGNVFKNNTSYGFSASGDGQLTLTNNIFSNNGRTGSVDVSKSFVHSGNTSEDIDYKGFYMNGTVSKDVVLSSGDLPYITQSLTIQNGGTLTLEPGLILKMDDYYSTGAIFALGGNLIAKGTPENKIYFTSLKDDSVGGDTNGDGNATSPAPQDWSSIYLEAGADVDFDNVTISYGGYRTYSGWLTGIYSAIYNLGADFSISNSFIGHNYGAGIFQNAGITAISGSELSEQNIGLWSQGGSAVISQSSLHANSIYAVYNESGPQIDARDNWWGDPSGPKDLSLLNPPGKGDVIYGNILYAPWLTNPQPTGSISVTTNLPTATFSISGPDNYSGSGTAFTVNNAPAGTYTITYDAVSGYKAPTSETNTLASGGNIAFTGTYSLATGTISVSTNLTGVEFQLTGPNSYTGITPLTILNVPVGTYIISYSSISGYATPPNETKDLIKSGTIAFIAAYVPLPVISTINPTSASPGTSIIVTGNYFGSKQGSGVVRFNSISATVISWDNTSIRATVPSVPSLNLSYNVSVATTVGTSNSVPFLVTSTGRRGAIPPGLSGLKPCPRSTNHGPKLVFTSSTNYTVLLNARETTVCSTSDNLTVNITLENNREAWYFVSIISAGTVGQGLPEHFLLRPNDKRVVSLTFRRGEQITFFADASFHTPPQDTQDRQLLAVFAAEFLWRSYSGSQLPWTVIDYAGELNPLVALGSAIVDRNVIDIINAIQKIAGDPLISTQLTALGIPIFQRFNLITNATRVLRILEFLTFELITAEKYPNDALTIKAQ